MLLQYYPSKPKMKRCQSLGIFQAGGCGRCSAQSLSYFLSSNWICKNKVLPNFLVCLACLYPNYFWPHCSEKIGECRILVLNSRMLLAALILAATSVAAAQQPWLSITVW